MEERFADSKLRKSLLKEGRYKCAYCGKRIQNATANIDHILPYKYGGKTKKRNLVPACWECNKAKGNRSVYLFMKDKKAHNLRIQKRLDGRKKWQAEAIRKRQRAARLIQESEELLAWLPWGKAPATPPWR